MTSDARHENPDSWASQLKTAILLCVLPLVVGLWLVMLFVLFVLMIPFYIAFSRLVWRSTHEKRMESLWNLDLDGSVHLECPDCQSKLTAGKVTHEQETKRDGSIMMVVQQSAFCENCNASYQRTSLGKIWGGWNAVIMVESDTPAESR